MLRKNTLVGFFASLVTSALFFSTAQAAPQVLALLSTQGPVQLNCQGGECAATLSSFCLQSERSSPAAGTAYQLAEASAVKITGVDWRGHEVSLHPQREFKLIAERTQVAVRISIPEKRLGELGINQVSVTVGDNVTLLPVPVPGDDDPLSESEITLAKSVLRESGSRIIDSNGHQTDAVRWLAYLANALPKNAGDEAGVRQRVVEGAISGPLQAMSREAGELAKGTLSGCLTDLKLYIHASLRRCIESSHDAYMWNLNADYWQAVRTGS